MKLFFDSLPWYTFTSALAAQAIAAVCAMLASASNDWSTAPSCIPATKHAVVAMSMPWANLNYAGHPRQSGCCCQGSPKRASWMYLC